MRRTVASLATIAVASAFLLAQNADAAGPIQPGVYAVVGNSACTFNFVYDGSGPTTKGKVYIGLAAHCVSKVGDPVHLRGGETIGEVAFVGNADLTAEDYAFVRVLPEHVDRVNPAVKGHPSYPTGVTNPEETREGDAVQISGHGIGFGFTTTTQEGRQAVMGYDDGRIHEVVGPLIFGDSGGPLVHVPTGKAMGIVSRLCVGVCEEEGPTVLGLLMSAEEAGFPVKLRTVR